MQGTSIGVRSRDLNDLIGKLKHGLPVGACDRLRERLDVPEKMLASTVNIAYRTLSRRKKEGRFKTDESERVLRIAKLYEKALDVLKSSSICSPDTGQASAALQNTSYALLPVTRVILKI